MTFAFTLLAGLGNPRGNENPFLLTMGVLWFRYHNYKARQLAAVHPEYDDEELFNEARKWVIAVQQVRCAVGSQVLLVVGGYDLIVMMVLWKLFRSYTVGIMYL